MKPELGKFPEGRLKLTIRFRKDSNFWMDNQEEATWVPTLEEVDLLKEALDATDEHNKNKHRKP